MAAKLKMVVRTLGLVWVGVIGILAWEHVPQVSAVAAPVAAQSASSVREASSAPPAPAANAPRVVYQGTVTAVASNERRAPTPSTKVPAGQERGEAPAQIAAAPQAVVSTAPVAAPPASPVTQIASLPDVPAAEPANAVGRVNLNTASVAELNGLGGGMIGRAIVAGRPYRETEDLLSKRVLNRSTFARIKDQVAAR